MFDFLDISTRPAGKNGIDIYPRFKLYPKSKDLMVRGGDFYAVWLEERGQWSTNEDDCLRLIDDSVREFFNEFKPKHPELSINVKYMRDSDSGMIDAWHKFVQKQSRDSYHVLDETLIFSNDSVEKGHYSSKRLPYPLEKGEIPAYEKIISTLYSEEERRKIEWAIGSIVSGDSKHIQKFVVLYGDPGSGKSTILNIIQQLFDGYYCIFDAKALGMASSQFALEPFRVNPLVAIQHDGDLSRIEDNTRINSIASHEEMTVNEKHKSTYTSRFQCFMFLGTNKPVKITDSKSGLIRRLIDVQPSGKRLSRGEYDAAMSRIPFELGGIAYHCLEVYNSNPGFYNDYIPLNMMGASNDFYNFMIDSYHIFLKEDGTTQKAAWEMYKNYCEDAKVAYPYTLRLFKEELKSYFRKYESTIEAEDGSRLKYYYSGFKTDKFENDFGRKEEVYDPNLIQFKVQKSLIDELYSALQAQYSNQEGKPRFAWDDVRTTLADVDTSMEHYVRPPENHVVIDFDLKDENGNKSFERNLRAASKWPATYAELSKSGAGIHLHYIYTGDVTKLSRIFEEDVEIKVFSGKSSLRRRLSKCNDLPIATLTSGLPTKGDEDVVDFKGIANEKAIRTLIKRNINKEYHASTKCSIDYINKILNDAYNSGMGYDVSDMRNGVFAFAVDSTNQSDYCIKLVNQMKWKSEEPNQSVDSDIDILVFYDVEVFPNLFLVNWKVQGEDKPVVRMINPTPSEIEGLLKFKLVGFNNRRYDNHMLYARLMGYTNEQLFNLSQKIISGDKNAFFGEAYNLSYTDIYDFSSKKQSLKKFEIELGITHKELGLPWDQPVPEDRWTEVAEYCDNDVIATEAVFEARKADFVAREILADLAGGIVNDTTNSLTTKIIFGNNKKPQSQFNYRDLSKPVYNLPTTTYNFLRKACPEMMKTAHGPSRDSVLPYFPGYKFEGGKSIYRGVEVGEGGCVYAQPGMYVNVALLDIASMHPHSVIAECLFGVEFTTRFKEIVDGRVSIKHEAWEAVNQMLDGKLTKFIQRVLRGELTSKDLANALKIAINSVYGLTAANFDNPFRDIRNVDNIVAKRGALFMLDLKYEVERRGYTVAHIKTDSIKIPDADDDIIQFVMDFGKRYGYTFEHEATYEKMCLVNDAVYIAKYKNGEWTATGTQFQVPYVFKTLFSGEPIEFDDMCETKSVSTALYLKDLDSDETIIDLETGKESTIKFENTVPKFVGKVGRFCPVKPEDGGMELLRESKDKDGNIKYGAATGTKGYHWLEAEVVKELGLEDKIDKSYYNKLVDDAVDSISKYGDFEWFTSNEPYISPDFINRPETDVVVLPFI